MTAIFTSDWRNKGADGLLRVQGILVEKKISTASSPAVRYDVSYSSARTEAANPSVTVTLTVTTRLGSASSRLGTGIRLTFFARLNGGKWRSVVLKDNADYWEGSAPHEVNLTLTGKAAADAAAVEWHVSRVGSVYGGYAGIVGSTDAPERHTLGLPGYAAPGGTPSSTVEGAGRADSRYAYVRHNGQWKKAAVYVRSDGIWKKASFYVKRNGMWKAV